MDGRIGEVAVLSISDTVLQAEGSSNIAVGLSISETASPITGLGDGRASTLSSVESTAALLAIRILLAWSSDKSISSTMEAFISSLDANGD